MAPTMLCWPEKVWYCCCVKVRPYLIADGGDVSVAAVEGGTVLLRLEGACGTCPSSTATMKMGIERALKVPV